MTVPGNTDRKEQSMSQIVVYTCIVGGYDQLLDQPNEPGVRYICFTDAPPKRAGSWEIRPLLSPPEMRDGTLINRFHKVMCYDRFEDTPTSIYMDGNVQLLMAPSEIVRQVTDRGAAIAGLSHKWRNSVESELQACARKLSPDQMARARELVAMHRDRGFPDDRGLSANFLLVRDTRNERLKRSMGHWWECIRDHVPRDQLSLQYSLWAEQVEMLRLDDHAERDSIARRAKHLRTSPWSPRHLLKRWLRKSHGLNPE